MAATIIINVAPEFVGEATGDQLEAIAATIMERVEAEFPQANVQVETNDDLLNSVEVVTLDEDTDLIQMRVSDIYTEVITNL